MTYTKDAQQVGTRLPMPTQQGNIRIVKRTGEETSLDISRIREVVQWACAGLGEEGSPNANPIALEAALTTRLRNGVTTREIQDNLIDCALQMCSPEEPDWRYVAGRLHIWNIWKDIQVLRKRTSPYGSYANVATEKVISGIYSPDLGQYSWKELEEAGKWINPYWDLEYDYAGAVLLSKRYLLDNELPQEALLTCALLLALPEKPEQRLFWARKFYQAIASRKISLATPILANLRVPKGSLSSCFIVAMEDNLESIYREITNTARISKNGGGVGVNVSRIRATGSWVMGNKNASGGVIPWIKLLNDTAIAVNQGGRRAGAVTVGLDIWHLDVPEFLEIQTENGDQRRKAYDVFCQLVVTDEFMRRVKMNQSWTLLDPYEVRKKFGIELAELWGGKFDETYRYLEDNLNESPHPKVDLNNPKLTLYQKISAKELFKNIMRSQVETGMPYIAYKDTINKANPNKHEGYIPGVNLCVAPETYVLTDRGQFPIAELEGQSVNVWNGIEWSEVIVRKTGENQPLLKVNLSNGESLECTYYHHFWLKDTYRSSPRWVEAKDLKPGDKLIKYNLPIIESDDDIEFPYAYTSGFFSGDGSYSVGGLPEIDLYDNKKKLVNKLEIRNKRHGSRWGSKELDAIAIYDDVKQGRLVCKLPLDIPPKFTVPINGYTVKSRLDWLAGLLDSDGCVYTNETNQSLAISSIHKEFLLEIRLMLQTLGVDSKVALMQSHGYRAMPDGKGGTKDYFCQAGYRLIIASIGLFQLSQLGLKTHRLKWASRKPQRSASKFIRVVDVELTCRRDDTYCFTEPKRHLGMFNGILTGQCVESFSNVVPGQLAHTCNLNSLNLANIEDEELPEMCRLAVRMLDNTIEITTTPLEESAAHNNRYRTIGVGAMGLADWLAKRYLSYGHIREISHLFEDIGYYCTHTSMELAKERGAYPAFEGSEWSKGNLINSKTPGWFSKNAYDSERWLQLAKDVILYGIRNSHILAIAPNTSSSLVQGCTASILPVFSRFFYDKWAKGTVPIAPPFIGDRFWYYKENKTLPQSIVVSAVSEIQKWIDTGISMELVFNLNAGVYFPDEPDRSLKAKDIYDVLIQAWESGCKAIYYIRTVQKDSYTDAKQECVSCAN